MKRVRRRSDFDARCIRGRAQSRFGAVHASCAVEERASLDDQRGSVDVAVQASPRKQDDLSSRLYVSHGEGRGPTLGPVGEQLRPNLLTDYLYELSKAFSRFYDRKMGVRVIDASPDEVRLSRLRLCDLTARTLRLGLELLGIGVVEQM